MPPKFEVVEEPDQPPPKMAIDAIVLGLKVLSQRTIIALSNLFSLITCASVFWLALTVVPHDPTVLQLIGLGGYAVFIVAVNVIVRRA